MSIKSNERIVDLKTKNYYYLCKIFVKIFKN